MVESSTNLKTSELNFKEKFGIDDISVKSVVEFIERLQDNPSLTFDWIFNKAGFNTTRFDHI